MKFGKKLQELRKKKGFSQEDLANELNVTRQTVSKWELGETVPDMNKLIEIAKLFDISLDELTGGEKMNEYTNENNIYKETNHEKKNAKLALKTFFIGTILCLIITGIGIFKQIDAKNTDKKSEQQALKLSEQKIEQAKITLKELESQYNELEKQYNEKSQECDIINQNMTSDDWYIKSSKCMEEKTKLSSKMSEIEMDATTIKNADYTAYYQPVDKLSYKIFYYIGAGVFGVDILISLIFFLSTRKK